MVNIAILGFGLIGSGVADVFMENESVISKKMGDTIHIKYIVDIKEIINHPLSDRHIKDFNIVLNDPEISLVVETLSGAAVPHLAFQFTKAALEKGINVVTSSKAVVAAYGAELLGIAAKTNARYLFEASVGGGIPIIRPIYNCLAANKINQITAILNGTTNFILTKMSNESLDFDVALKMAQENGFAESDPSDDIDGKDTCRKICILSSLAFGKQLPPEKVYTEGIRDITLEDIRNAEKINYKIKLIAKAKQMQDSFYVMVAPMLVSRSSQLYNIDDVFNGIVVTGNAIGDVMFCGRGAGKLPTASAVAADVMDALEKSTKNIMWDVSDGNYVSDYKKQSVKYYIRIENSSLAADIISKIFPDIDIHDIHKSQSGNELFFITDEFCESELDNKIKLLSDSGLNILSKIRII